jgi:hypothetical protein
MTSQVFLKAFLCFYHWIQESAQDTVLKACRLMSPSRQLRLDKQVFCLMGK